MANTASVLLQSQTCRRFWSRSWETFAVQAGETHLLNMYDTLSAGAELLRTRASARSSTPRHPPPSQTQSRRPSRWLS